MKRDVDIVLWKQTDSKFFNESLISGANGIQFDFDDSYSPTWRNNIISQHMLMKYLEDLTVEKYQKNAVVLVRPRSLNLDEKHITIGNIPLAGAFFDYGVWVYHYIRTQYKNSNGVKDGPYFYLPKIESYLEARLWDEIFYFTEEKFGIPEGNIKAFVHIENVLASFQMEEILYELKDHCLGLNTGRWDYIFSFIKKFRAYPSFVVPDRDQLTMDKTFLITWEKLIVDVCKKRGAFATGGMAPFVPWENISEADLDDLRKKVYEGKLREKNSGLIGALVAHPIFVEDCRRAFEQKLQMNDYMVLNLGERELASRLIEVPKGPITMDGVKYNVKVVVNYLCSWIRGNGGCPLNGSVEDLATCEISRSQLWQWIKHKVKTVKQEEITYDIVMKFVQETLHQKKDNDKRVKKAISQLLDVNRFIDFIPTILYDQIIYLYNVQSKL